MNPGFDILLEDGPVLLVLKPAGIATQAPPGIDSLESRIRAYLKQRDAKPGNIYLGIPHRLDRPVSGVMVFARHVRAARRLAQQFEARTVRKLYWAAVAGRVDPESGTWTDTLWKVYGQPRAQVVDAGHPEGQHAVLHYRTLGYHPHGTWLEIELETGRTHQVRVQAASRGYPVLGDEMYGCAIPFGPRHEDVRLRQIALHARLLEFDHPMTKARVSQEAPVDANWHELGIPEPHGGAPG
jgi:RluA family pseudouridine synthase